MRGGMRAATGTNAPRVACQRQIIYQWPVNVCSDMLACVGTWPEMLWLDGRNRPLLYCAFHEHRHWLTPAK